MFRGTLVACATAACLLGGSTKPIEIGTVDRVSAILNTRSSVSDAILDLLLKKWFSNF